MSSTILKAQNFAEGLADPFAPTSCPVCFAFFAGKVEPDEQIAPLLRTKCHGFWTALMVFVSSDWTAERQESVRAHLQRTARRCGKCKPAGRAGTLKHELPDAECFFGVVYQLSCGLLHAAMINPVHTYKGLGRKPSRWPATAEQLFPFGVERTVSALVAQLRHRNATHTLLHNLVSYNRPLVLPVLYEARNRAVVISTFIQRLTIYTSAASAALEGLGLSATPVEQRSVRQKYIKLAQVMILVLFDIVAGQEAQPDDQARFCHGHEIRLFRVLHDFITLITGNEDCPYMRHLGGKLWIALSPSQRVEAGCPAPPAYSTNIDSGEALQNPYCALRYFLRNRTRTRTCCSRECPTSAQYESARLLLCAKCRIVSYCSQRCQKADWTDAVLPHKDVCDALQELRLFTPLDSDEMTPDQFAAACVEHEFPLARVDTLIVWATQGRVATHYAHGRESLSKLLQPRAFTASPKLPADIKPAVDHYEPAQPAESKRVFMKIAGVHEIAIDFPRSEDGSDLTDREIHQGMSGVRARMEAMGLPISWRTC